MDFCRVFFIGFSLIWGVGGVGRSWFAGLVIRIVSGFGRSTKFLQGFRRATFNLFRHQFRYRNRLAQNASAFLDQINEFGGIALSQDFLARVKFDLFKMPAYLSLNYLTVRGHFRYSRGEYLEVFRVHIQNLSQLFFA